MSNSNKKKPTIKQILAWIAILILIVMYAINLILALIGSEYALQLLKVTMVMTIAFPILLYGMLVVMQGAGHFMKKPEDELTEEEKIGYYQMLEERDEKRYQERRKAKEEKQAKKKRK